MTISSLIVDQRKLTPRYRAGVVKAATLVLLAALVVGCSDSSPRTGTGAPADETPSDPAPGLSNVQAAWWSWSETAPADQSPVDDRTGEHCAVGQTGSTWFLAGTYGGAARRDCDVPADTTLIVPAVNLVAPSGGDCIEFMSDARGQIKLDGTGVPLVAIRGEQIVFDTPDGKVEGIGCGLWARIEGLSVGQHRLTLVGRSGSFRTKVTYRLRGY